MGKNLYKHNLTIFLMAIFLVVGCSPPSHVMESPDFKERIATIKTVSMEKPEVQVLLGTSKNNAHRQTEEEIEATKLLTSYIAMELQKRRIQMVEFVESQAENQADGKMKISMRIFKRPGGDNTSEFAGKMAVAIMTMGLVTTPKDPSGGVTLQVLLYDKNEHELLWSNMVNDTSFCLVGEASFDLEKLVAELFQPFVEQTTQ